MYDIVQRPNEDRTWEAGEYVSPLIKRITVVRETEGQAADTLNVSEYRKGKRMRYIHVEKNKRVPYCISYVYQDTLLMGWHDSSCGKPGYSTTVTFAYDNSKRKIYERNVWLYLKDTNWNHEQYYTYDTAGRLLKRLFMDRGKQDRAYMFFYEGGKLVRSESHGELPGYYSKTHYTYDSAGFLSSRKDFQVRKDMTDTLGFNDYVYRNGRMVRETEHRFLDSIATEYVFEYDEQGRITSSVVTRDTVTTSLYYHYEKGRLAWVDHISNFDPVSRSRVNTREEYRYDNHGSLVERRQFSKGKLISTRKYITEYY